MGSGTASSTRSSPTSTRTATRRSWRSRSSGSARPAARRLRLRRLDRPLGRHAPDLEPAHVPHHERRRRPADPRRASANNWQTYNNYRQNRLTAGCEFAQPDLVPSFVRRADGRADITLTARIGNAGGRPAPAGRLGRLLRRRPGERRNPASARSSRPPRSRWRASSTSRSSSRPRPKRSRCGWSPTTTRPRARVGRDEQRVRLAAVPPDAPQRTPPGVAPGRTSGSSIRRRRRRSTARPTTTASRWGPLRHDVGQAERPRARSRSATRSAVDTTAHVWRAGHVRPAADRGRRS